MMNIENGEQLKTVEESTIETSVVDARRTTKPGLGTVRRPSKEGSMKKTTKGSESRTGWMILVGLALLIGLITGFLANQRDTRHGRADTPTAMTEGGSYTPQAEIRPLAAAQLEANMNAALANKAEATNVEQLLQRSDEQAREIGELRRLINGTVSQSEHQELKSKLEAAEERLESIEAQLAKTGKSVSLLRGSVRSFRKRLNKVEDPIVEIPLDYEQIGDKTYITTPDGRKVEVPKRATPVVIDRPSDVLPPGFRDKMPQLRQQ